MNWIRNNCGKNSVYTVAQRTILPEDVQAHLDLGEKCVRMQILQEFK